VNVQQFAHRASGVRPGFVVVDLAFADEPTGIALMYAKGLAARRRCRLALEYLIVYFVVVGAYIIVRIPGGPIPALLLAGLAVVLYLRRRPDFDNRGLLRAAALRPALPAILALWAATSAVMVAGVALLDPDRLFDLPRQHTALWAAIVVFYPVASVYPQELLFRAFPQYRYAPVFGTGRAAAASSALAFGFAHLLFGNLLAVIATLAGGWLFARRYQQTRSLLTVSVEHALYGVTIFTVGLGHLFYHGVQR
jgi:membrane protease YdiL (CAAX protease family)